MALCDPQFKLRIPAELKQRVKKAAVANGRTLNAEIVQRLSASLLMHASNADGSPAHSSTDHLMVRMERDPVIGEIQISEQLVQVIRSLSEIKLSLDGVGRTRESDKLNPIPLRAALVNA